MADIRKACKIFLDFVYDNQIIPEEIINILKESSLYGDIRKILPILQWNNQYGKGNNDDSRIANIAYLFNGLDKQRRNWLNTDVVRKGMDTLKSICNDFFHNVFEYDSDYPFFALTCSAIIDRADFVDKEKRHKYICAINEALNLPLKNPTVEKNRITQQRTSSTITDEMVLVAYCFSTFEHDCLYPTTTQTSAFEKAAIALKCKESTLRQIRDAFDGHNDNSRAGYYQKPLTPYFQRIKDEYERKGKNEAIREAKKILNLS